MSTDRRQRRPSRASIGFWLAMLAWPLSALIPAPVLAAGFDVSVTVESAAADPTPELAFTGASLWVLIALVAVLLAAGSVMLEESRRRSGSTT